MKRIAIKFFGILILGFSTFSQAKSIEFQGVDIRPVVDFFAKQVTPLKRSFTVYNWSRAGAVGDSDNLGIAENGSKTFWSRYGDPTGNSNSYGYGLYGAADPIYTMSYGGYGEDWLLLEMEFPAGFRLLDLGRSMMMFPQAPAEVQTIMNNFNCPFEGSVERLFSAGGFDIKTKCQSLVKKIFQNELQIDGFAYFYGETPFKDCRGSSNGGFMSGKAFVVTESKWMKPGLVHYYNSKSSHYHDRRILIQTLIFSTANGSETYFAKALNDLASYMEDHPDQNLKNSSNKCEGDTCIITVNFCDSKGVCENIALSALPRPGGPLILKKDLSKVNMPGGYAPLSLLWSDLEGVPKATTVREWLKSNKFGCSDKMPYED